MLKLLRSKQNVLHAFFEVIKNVIPLLRFSFSPFPTSQKYFCKIFCCRSTLMMKSLMSIACISNSKHQQIYTEKYFIASFPSFMRLG